MVNVVRKTKCIQKKTVIIELHNIFFYIIRHIIFDKIVALCMSLFMYNSSSSSFL